MLFFELYVQKRVPENEFLEEVINIKRDLSELIENRIYCVPVKKKCGNFIKVVLVAIQLFVSMTRSRIGSLSVLVGVLGLWVSWQQSGRALWHGGVLVFGITVVHRLGFPWAFCLTDDRFALFVPQL